MARADVAVPRSPNRPNNGLLFDQLISVARISLWVSTIREKQACGFPAFRANGTGQRRVFVALIVLTCTGLHQDTKHLGTLAPCG